jgi:hypothetical protein
MLRESTGDPALRCLTFFRERWRVSKAPLAALSADAALTRAARSLFSRQLPERRQTRSPLRFDRALETPLSSVWGSLFTSCPTLMPGAPSAMYPRIGAS